MVDSAVDVSKANLSQDLIPFRFAILILEFIAVDFSRISFPLSDICFKGPRRARRGPGKKQVRPPSPLGLCWAVVKSAPSCQNLLSIRAALIVRNLFFNR